MGRWAWALVALVFVVYLALFVRYAAHWTSDRNLWVYVSELRPVHPFAVANRVMAEHTPQTGFVYEDGLWSNACDAPVNPQPMARGMRGWPRSLAQASWCWQLRRGDSVARFHLVNLALHLAVAIGLGVLIADVAGVASVGVAVAALFAVHPLVTESAVYLAGRGELIAGLGVVLACLAAVRGRWLLACLAVGLGLLGKESAIVALVAAPLVLYAKGRIQPLTAVICGFWLSAGVLVVTLAWHLETLSLGDRARWALLQSTAALWLLVLSVLPLWQSPLHVYGYVPIVARGLCLLALGGLGAWAWRQRLTAPLVACGVGWMLLTALPRLIVPTPPSVLNEHQWYTPLMGLSFLTADRLKAWSA